MTAPVPGSSVSARGSVQRGAFARAVFAIPNLARLMWGMMRDRRVALLDKALVVGALAYLVSPIDILPDFVPFFGQIDDVVVLLLAMRRLLARTPVEVMAEHWHGDPAWLEANTLSRMIAALTWFVPRLMRRRAKK